MPSREEQYQQRKKQLEEIALNLFLDKGYDGTTTKELAKVAKISSGLLFHYFETKEALFDHLWHISFDYFKGFLSEISLTKTPKQLIETIVTKLFNEYKTTDKAAKYILFVVMYRNHFTTNEKVSQEQGELNKIVAALAPTIRLGQELGEFKKDNPTALAGAFLGFIYGVTINFVSHQFPLPEVSWVVEILTRE